MKATLSLLVYSLSVAESPYCTLSNSTHLCQHVTSIRVQLGYCVQPNGVEYLRRGLFEQKSKRILFGQLSSLPHSSIWLIDKGGRHSLDDDVECPRPPHGSGTWLVLLGCL